ncbi:lipopolysaccharide biosynthesis protein [Chitinivibrio alkaliphilus]|uniref:MATE-like superfamily protein n=1 Tax=Chitinivibrio alkaliphilus ACht1 TaxID=1313304 RepID=U7D8Q7_9BACT|nr:oligosaccharide flippase family protein [Chitinivibrio alkaliphilus]ERP31477.1 MATE-like superfamily protein [Chitinivibrio alkaliphilus ACht1]
MHNLTQNILSLSGAVGYAKVVSLLITPLITRLFSPEEYGYYTTFMAALAMISVGAVKYENTLVLQSCKKDFSQLCTLTLSIVLFIFLAVLTFTTTQGTRELFSIPHAPLLALAYLSTSLFDIFKKIQYQKNQFRRVAWALLLQSTWTAGGKLLSGIFSWGSTGLILSGISGVFLAALALLYPLPTFNITSPKALWAVAQKYQEFPRYTFPTTLLSAFVVAIPPLYLSWNFSSATAGYYGLAYAMVRVPAQIIGSAVNDAYYAEAGKRIHTNPKALKQITTSLRRKSLLISTPFLLFFILLAPSLFTTLFGAAWHEAGVYAQILPIMVFADVIFEPAGRLFEAARRQKILFRLIIFRVLSIVFFLLAVNETFQSPLLFLCGYCSINTLFSLIIHRTALSHILGDTPE